MRKGFTTGSCAAAAAKAAAYMLLTGKEKKQIKIETPAGIPFCADLVDICRKEARVSCGVIKDGGDDPDITTGAHIMAELSFLDEKAEETIEISGGLGVGRVTKPGLDQPVGNAAINHVPREMIRKEVLEVCRLCDYKGGLKVVIWVPEGEKLAEATFNPRLGILGGISILGTSGIVEPMSQKALLDTIEVEIKQKKALHYPVLAVSPGNYGLDFMKEHYAFDLDKSVKCSNFIGDTIEMAIAEGFDRMLLTGHIGKLIKVAGGILNTHSKEGDCRMELLCAAAIYCGASAACARALLEAVTTEDGIAILEKEGLVGPVMERILNQILFYLKKKAAGRIQIECILYSNQYGLLGESQGAADFLKAIKTKKD